MSDNTNLEDIIDNLPVNKNDSLEDLMTGLDEKAKVSKDRCVTLSGKIFVYDSSASRMEETKKKIDEKSIELTDDSDYDKYNYFLFTDSKEESPILFDNNQKVFHFNSNTHKVKFCRNTESEQRNTCVSLKTIADKNRNEIRNFHALTLILIIIASFASVITPKYTVSLILIAIALGVIPEIISIIYDDSNKEKDDFVPTYGVVLTTLLFGILVTVVVPNITAYYFSSTQYSVYDTSNSVELRIFADELNESKEGEYEVTMSVDGPVVLKDRPTYIRPTAKTRSRTFVSEGLEIEKVNSSNLTTTNIKAERIGTVNITVGGSDIEKVSTEFIRNNCPTFIVQSKNSVFGVDYYKSSEVKPAIQLSNGTKLCGQYTD